MEQQYSLRLQTKEQEGKGESWVFRDVNREKAEERQVTATDLFHDSQQTMDEKRHLVSYKGCGEGKTQGHKRAVERRVNMRLLRRGSKETDYGGREG